MSFLPENLPPAIAALLDAPLSELGPGKPHEKTRGQLSALTAETLGGGKPVRDREAAEACLAGLWLRHDFLAESHALSQEIASVEGSYWHGIMHRREPDYGNAKYWFRRVDVHDVFADFGAASAEMAGGETLNAAAKFLVSGSWDPYRFIDLCEAIARGQSKCGDLAQRVAHAEWELLFAHCWRQAFV